MKSRALRIAISMLALLALPWVVNANPENGFIVAIVNLECPHCREIFQQEEGIRAMVNEAGFGYRSAPVPNHTKSSSAWSARTYYASRILPGNKPEEVMRALYEAQDTEPLRSKERVLAWMQMTVPEVEWQRFFPDHVNSEKTLVAVDKAISLAKEVQVAQFPSFVFVGNGTPQLIAGSGENAELVTQLKHFLEKNQ